MAVSATWRYGRGMLPRRLVLACPWRPGGRAAHAPPAQAALIGTVSAAGRRAAEQVPRPPCRLRLRDQPRAPCSGRSSSAWSARPVATSEGVDLSSVDRDATSGTVRFLICGSSTRAPTPCGPPVPTRSLPSVNVPVIVADDAPSRCAASYPDWLFPAPGGSASASSPRSRTSGAGLQADRQRRGGVPAPGRRRRGRPSGSRTFADYGLATAVVTPRARDPGARRHRARRLPRRLHVQAVGSTPRDAGTPRIASGVISFPVHTS